MAGPVIGAGILRTPGVVANEAPVFWAALLMGTVVHVPMVLIGANIFVFKIQVAVVVFAAVLYNASYFALRLNRPRLHRPLRAFGHPVLPALILAITVMLFAAVVIADPVSGMCVVGLIAICLPVGLHLGRERRRAGLSVGS